MEQCPLCAEAIRTALVVCAGCGETLPLRVLLVSEGSQGGGFALVEEQDKAESKNDEEQVYEDT